MFHRGRGVYGKTSPERDVIEVAGPSIEHKAVTLAHELGHVATGELESSSESEKAAWAWAIPRLEQSGLWTSRTRRRVIRNTSLRGYLDFEISQARGEPYYQPSKESKELAKRGVGRFLSAWPVEEES